MNKIKLLYDIATTMKKSDKIAGVLGVRVRKDQDEVFTLRNEFEKATTGQAKTTVSAELNLDGRHVKRESTTEFELSGCCGHGHGHGPGMLRRMFHGKGEGDRCCGVRGVFGKLSAAFGILNGIEAEEREDGGARLTLNLDALPEELKAGLLEKLRHKAEHCCHHGSLAGCQVEAVHGQVTVEVDRERKIEKIVVGLDGSMSGRDEGVHEVTASGEVAFAW
ncbi:hypothetical protein L4X63_02965 [Geomonas sp. Red32]|uniref:hypothetical protein n=1 Tax=Geomonas sp. Red32 TaxID=2912856 RepID=UPI00202CD5A1|nr:hypothetical protein [Geomonas sp. Red32]MCM0080543.1 hypothetical protein [Geomonas sp. Red32]